MCNFAPSKRRVIFCMELNSTDWSQYLSHPVFSLISDVADEMGRECFVIGGFVRDIMLNRPSKDIDVVSLGSGIEIAEALVKNGISAAVLAYRVPENRDGALMDAQRAIRYVRAHAKDFNINPDKVAIMGFSAGANLSARASTQFDAVAYKAADAIDKFSAKPNLTGLIYPAYCDNQNFEKRWYGIRSDEQAYDKKYALAPDLKISKDTPPAFLVETQPDPYVDASIAYYLALKKAGIPACLHLFDKGKHGYGLRNKTDLVSQWFDLYVKWLKHNGL